LSSHPEDEYQDEQGSQYSPPSRRGSDVHSVYTAAIVNPAGPQYNENVRQAHPEDDQGRGYDTSASHDNPEAEAPLYNYGEEQGGGGEQGPEYQHGKGGTHDGPNLYDADSDEEKK
jgi:hypothetical protein